MQALTRSHALNRLPSQHDQPLCLQVVDSKVVVDKPARGPLKPQKVAECTVGDETGTILLTARNEQGGCQAALPVAASACVPSPQVAFLPAPGSQLCALPTAVLPADSPPRVPATCQCCYLQWS